VVIDGRDRPAVEGGREMCPFGPWMEHPNYHTTPSRQAISVRVWVDDPTRGNSGLSVLLTCNPPSPRLR